MFLSTERELIAGIDRLVGGPELDREAIEGLRKLLYPRAGWEQWPDLPVVVHVLSTPAIGRTLESGAMEADLAQLLLDLISATGPLLGARPFGPLAQQVAYFRERYVREEKKYHLVAERIGSRPEEDVLPMLMAYLSMEPAPYFLHRLRQQHKEAINRAEEGLAEEAVRWRSQTKVIALLETLEGDEESAGAALREVLDELAMGPMGDFRSVKRGVSSGDAQARLVAGAVAVYSGYDDLAALLLAHVVSASAYPLQLAAFAALLDRELTREGLSAWLIDVVWGNPEEPEAEMTVERRDAAMAARAILPHVGSPLPHLDNDEGASQVAAKARWFFALWRRAGRRG